MQARCVLTAIAFASFATAAPATQTNEFFESKIRPLFAANCFSCHTASKMGGLELTSKDALLKGGNSGPAVVPGDPGKSLLMQAVRRTHPRIKMPPTAPLEIEQVNLLAEWIEQGAEWPETKVPVASKSVVTAEQRQFWSFRPVTKPALPKVSNKAWAASSIDHFILAALDAKNLQPNKPAHRRTLIRRASLDLTGLPPTPEQVEEFVADNSPDAFKKVVERLLASQQYGERWGRHWLDLARYSDGQLAAGVDTPFPNSHRYRDWVVDAFNKDLPYDKFVAAQIAGDLIEDKVQRDALVAGIGFQALGSRGDDQVDVTTKVFLGLTVGCAQCHDHKYDPIPTRDYYSLVGVFRSSQISEHPLVAADQVKAYQDQKKKVDAVKEIIDDYLLDQQKQLATALARHTAKYMVAAWRINKGLTPDKSGLDQESLDRWVGYLKDSNKEHPYMKEWFEATAGNPTGEQVRSAAEKYQKFALELMDDAREVEDKNYVAFGGRKGMKDERTRQYTNIVSLPVLKFYQWRELASGPYNIDGFRAPAGIYYYGGKDLERWLGGFAKTHLESLRAELKALEKELPPMYPFLHALKDSDKPADARVAIRGDGKNLGEVAPRGFLTVLSPGEPKRFTHGSGRLELAQAIASPDNPLTARVMVNRIWQHHFGAGIVRTPSNFGQMGERPTHPELLDWLAARFVESGWSVKAIHREILLSNTYALSSANSEAAAQVDPENKLLWRANARPRLDLESLRDSILAVTGKLDATVGGPAKPLADDNFRRTLYITVSRTRLDATMALFDFPDANATAEARPTTVGPLQGLFFLNSKFVQSQARALEQRLAREAGTESKARIRRAYQLLYGRPPDPQETDLGLQYLAAGEKSWEQYLQALLGSAEFTSLN